MKSIKHEMLSGIFWSAIEKYSGFLVSLIVSAILARLISPSDFGVVSIATVFISFLTLFSTMGIFPAVIQKELTKNEIDVIFTFSLLVGLILSICLFFTADVISKFYKEEQLSLICKILSLNLFLASLNLVPSALMAKHKRFKEIAIRTFSLQLISGMLSVFVAYKNGGVFALLISPILTMVGCVLYNLYCYPCHIKVTLDFSPIKKIASYSIFQFLFDLTNFFSRNLDKMIIGRYINMSSLGYYDKSYRLMLLPMTYISSVINPVMQPVLSSLQDELHELSEKYIKIIKSIAYLSFPISVFLFFSAYELINIVYGDRWNAAIPVFKVLSLSLPLQMILTTTGGIYQSCNATRQLFIVGFINTLITISGFIVSSIVFRSIIAIAISWDISNFLSFLISFFVLFKKVFKLSLLQLYMSFIKPFFVAVAVLLGLYLVSILEIPNIIAMLMIKLLVMLITEVSQVNIYQLACL